MTLTYFDALSIKFGNRSFTVKEVEFLTGNLRSAKLLSELKKRGLLRREGRGIYRCVLPNLSDERKKEWDRIEKIIVLAPFKKALTGPTAVSIWSDGRYEVMPNHFMNVFHLNILSSDYEKWMNYLKKKGVSTKGIKKVGAYVDLIPETKFSFTYKNNKPVIPKKEVLNLIKNHPAIYANASDLID
ncbi:MAG: hypothetical protein ACYDAO_03245 [Thermoplasmataceae archaeon]